MGFMQQSRPKVLIDTSDLELSDLKNFYPIVFQHLLDSVKPDRDANRDKWIRENWWKNIRPRFEWRQANQRLDRYIATCMTAKFRTFQVFDNDSLPDQALVVFALAGAEEMAILSSSIHIRWSLAAGGWLGVGNDPRYNNTRCFDPFPFPDLSDDQRTRLRALGEDLDAHRKRQQAGHPKLTLTQMYNVLEKLRAGETIEGKDREIYDQGLVGILKDLHDQIDAAVAEAYGWPVDLSDEDILFRLVALNKERAEEEARGHIRWLRPDYQNPEGRTEAKGKTADMDLGVAAKVEKAPWPKALPDQIAAVRATLEDMGEATPEQIARSFTRARTSTVVPLLESLAALGQAEALEGGRYAA